MIPAIGTDGTERALPADGGLDEFTNYPAYDAASELERESYQRGYENVAYTVTEQTKDVEVL